MAVQLKPRTFSPKEYLALERSAAFKSEYLHGQIFAMAGGSRERSAITANVTGEMTQQLKGTPCQAHSSDLKVRTSIEGLYAYPDLSIICGKPSFHDDQRDVVLNPIALVEVLSPSTESYDRGTKWVAYQQIETLRDYVMIFQTEPRIDLYSRPDKGDWVLSTHNGLDAAVEIPSIDCSLRLSEVYHRIELSLS